MSLGANIIPNILQTNAVNENQATRVESVILEADNHSWVQDQFGKTRFVLPKKATTLSPDGALVFKVNWSAHTDNTRAATLPRLSGCAGLISAARLYVGGRLLCETIEAGQKVALDNYFLPYDSQTEILDVKLGGNHKFSYQSVANDGLLKLEADIVDAKAGFRGLITGTGGYSQECSVPLRALFPMLKDAVIPSSNALRGEIRAEIDWNGVWDDCIVESGEVFGAGHKKFDVSRPRLMLDYVAYSDEIANALNEQVNSQQGIQVPYRQAVAVKSQMGVLTDMTDVQTHDWELGFQDRSVMKIYLQKKLAAMDNLFQRKTRSDGLLQENHQLTINNKTMYDRTIESFSEMYSHLSQTAERPFCNMAGTYGQYGDLNNVNIFNDDVANGAGDGLVPTETAGVRANYQGAMRYGGFNLAQSRTGADVPSNAINVGAAPMVLRIGRAGLSGGTDEKDGDDGAPDWDSAVNLTAWVECIKMLDIRNGVADTVEI